MQTECGHLFCRECLEPVLKRRRPICPLDKEDISQEGVRIIPSLKTCTLTLILYFQTECGCLLSFRYFQTMPVGGKFLILMSIVTL